MSLLVTGSIGIDTVSTPYGVSENCLGGSAVYFSMAASFFSPVRFLGAVGFDCPFDLSKTFFGRNVDLTGLERRQMSRTFRWKGSYHDSMNMAITDSVELNVLAEAPPTLPDKYKDSRFVFLANTAPNLQSQLLDQLSGPVFVAADTMDCWIVGRLNELKALLKRINCLIVNEDEARALAHDSNLISAGKKIIDMGPAIVVIKKGESGSIVFDNRGVQFILPAYPATEVKDPTGAGDSFAGAFMGYIANKEDTSLDTIKRAIAYGTVVASFTISDFSLNSLSRISMADIDKRVEVLRKTTEF